MTARALALVRDPDLGCVPLAGKCCEFVHDGDVYSVCVHPSSPDTGEDGCNEIPKRGKPAPSWCPFRAAPEADRGVSAGEATLLAESVLMAEDYFHPWEEDFWNGVGDIDVYRKLHATWPDVLAAARRVLGRE